MSDFVRRDNETEEEFENRKRIGIDKDVPGSKDEPVDPNAPPVDPNIEDPTQSPTTLDSPNPNFVPPEPHPSEVVAPGTEPEEVVVKEDQATDEAVVRRGTEEDEYERRD